MYTIQEVSQKTGLTAHTLRFYEKEGLLGAVKRSESGFRQYTDDDLDILSGICCLKNTGMSLREIARFLELSREGDSTLRQRVELLEAHRKKVLTQMEQMQTHLEKVTRKLACYTEMLRLYESRSSMIPEDFAAKEDNSTSSPGRTAHP